MAARRPCGEREKKLRRVLVVDDDRDLRWLLSSFLGAEGYEVITAEEGGAALDQVETQHPDVILLDLKMPGVDGVKTLERLRRKQCRVPVILLTAHHDILSPLQAARMGAYDFISKPFDNEDLLISLERALEKGDLSRAVEEMSTSVEEEKLLKQVVVDEWFDCEEGSWD